MLLHHPVSKPFPFRITLNARKGRGPFSTEEEQMRIIICKQLVYNLICMMFVAVLI